MAGAHLAAGRRHRGASGHGRAARRRARQGRHLRDDPLLPRSCSPRPPSGPPRWSSRSRSSRCSTARCSPSARRDIMRLIAYTSISHFGFIVLGIFAMTSTAARARRSTWSTTGSPRPALFLIAGFLVARRGSQADPRLRRLAAGHAGARRDLPRRRPVRPGPARPVVLRLGVPRPRRARSSATRWPAVIATLGIVLAALYILLMYQRIMTGPSPTFADGESRATCGCARSSSSRRSSPRSSSSASIPKPVLDLVNPAVDRTLSSSASPTRRRPTPPGVPSDRPMPTVFEAVDGRLRRRRADAHRRGAARSSGSSSRRSRRGTQRHAIQVWLALAGAARGVRGPAGLARRPPDRDPAARSSSTALAPFPRSTTTISASID